MEKLRLGFDYIGPSGPVANGFPFDIPFKNLNDGVIKLYFQNESNVFVGEFFKFLQYLKIDHETISIGSRPKDSYYLLIEPLGEPERFMGKSARPGTSFLQQISDVALNDVKSGKAKIIIFYAHESFNFFKHGLFDDLYQQITEKEIDPKNIILITGNEKGVLNHNQWLKDHPQTATIHLFQFSMFALLTHVNYHHYNYMYDTKPMISTLNEQLEAVHSGVKSKKFLCYNRLPKPSRWATISYLHQRDLLSHGHVSLFPSSDFGGYGDDFSDLLKDQPELLKSLLMSRKSLEPLLPLTIDVPDGRTNRAFTNEFCGQSEFSWPYLDTYFSLVNETWIDSETLFLSEKIFKPMAQFHPFLVLGNPGSLASLNSQGFLTFSKWIDESYDAEENFGIRLKKVCNEVERLTRLSSGEWVHLYEQMLPTLQHNRELIYSKSLGNSFIELIDKLKSLH